MLFPRIRKSLLVTINRVYRLFVLSDQNYRLSRRLVPLFAILALLGSCGGKESPTNATNDLQNDSVVQYGDSLLSVSPIPIDSILSLAPLGNLNPPSHTFPTDHCYLYLPVAHGANAPYVITLYCPGRLRIERVDAFEHVNAGITDYSISFALSDSVELRLGHVSSLDSSIFGIVSLLNGWQFINEYTTGGETYRMWRKALDTVVDAGTKLGTVGGNPGQWALDIGLYDWRRENGMPANQQIWNGGSQIHAFCPLEYYEQGPSRDSLFNLVDRVSVTGDMEPCGWVVQDVAGTAQGVWLNPSEPAPYPEDPHMALAWHSTDPSKQAFSIGTSVSSTGSGLIFFSPAASGLLNRRFDQVIPDGSTHGYIVTNPQSGAQMTIIIKLTDSATMQIEGLAGHLYDSSQWVFTSAKTLFHR